MSLQDEALREMRKRVNPEQFLFLTTIYSLAAQGNIHSPLSEELKPGTTGYRLSNIPMNRGMFAVRKELDDLGIARDAMMPFMNRVMMFYGALFRHERKLKKWIRRERNGVHVSESLIKACAVCGIYQDKNGIAQYELKSLKQAAEAYDKREARHAN